MDQRVTAHHARAVQHERTAVEYGADGALREWEIVMRFYAALHLVDAYLASKSPAVTPANHEERWRAIRAHKELSAGRGARLCLAYKRLESLSKEVRYVATFSVAKQHVDYSRQDLAVVRSFLVPKYTPAGSTTTG